MTSRSHQVLRLAAAAAALCLACAGPARAQVVPIFWNDGVDGLWSNPLNWNPNAVPDNFGTTTYEVTIDAPPNPLPYRVTLDIDATIDLLNIFSVTQNDAMLELDNRTLSVLGTLNLTRSRLSGDNVSGAIVVDGDVTFNDAVVDHNTFTANRNLFFTGSDDDYICDTSFFFNGSNAEWSGTGTLTFHDATQFTNSAASTFTILNSSTFQEAGFDGAAFINQGTLRKASAGTTSMTGIDLLNTGTLEAAAGTFSTDGVDVNGAGNTLVGGTWNVLAGATLDLVGQSIQNNEATILIQGAGSTFAALNDLADNRAAGTLIVDGASFATAGALANNGTLLALNSAAVTTAGALVNNSTLTIDSASTLDTAGDLTNTADLTIGTDAEVRVGAGFTLTNDAAGTLSGGAFAIAGTLAYDGAAIHTVDTTLTLDGPGAAIVDQLSADDALDGVITDIGAAGDLTVTNGRNITTADGSDFSVASSGALTVGAGSTFRVDPGSNLTNFAGGVFTVGTFDVAGTLQFDNARVETIDNTIVLDGPGKRIVDQDNKDAFRVLSLIDANGDVTVKNGYHLTTEGVTVLGKLTIGDGSGLRADDDTRVRVNGDFAHDSGDLAVNARLTVTGSYLLAARLLGTGTVAATVVNRGIIAPGPDAAVGTLTIVGRLLIEADGIILADLGGPIVGVDSDLLSIRGSLEFDAGIPAGTLRARSTPGFEPSLGDRFALLRFTERPADGRFAVLDLPALAPGLEWRAAYLEHFLVLRVVPAPGSALVLAALAVAAAARRRAA